MSKRSAASTRSTASAAKRPKKGHGFGAPSSDDKDPLTSQLAAPSSSALSIRSLPATGVPSLTTLCARVFVSNIVYLFKEKQEETQQWLKLLPEAFVPRLFSLMSATHPSRLTHPFITAYFLRGDPIILTGALPGVSTLTVQALSQLKGPLRELHLRDLEKIPDDVVARLIPHFPMLETLNLRGSMKVGKKTIDAVASSCVGLKAVNLSYTSVPPTSVATLTARCLALQVLKLTGLPNITDTTFATILHTESEPDGGPLAHLRNLKLRHTMITEVSLSRLTSRCPALSRLDVSFTPIRHPTSLSEHLLSLNLVKLSLTSTPLTSPFLQSLGTVAILCPIFTTLSNLQIGALGASPSSSISTLAGSLTLTDQILDSLTEILVNCRSLENINLVGNTKLGLHTGKNSALAMFVRRVGRRCKILNLASISRLRSSDLAGLLPLHERPEDANVTDDGTELTPSPLHTLVLNNTDVGDEAAPYIASCTNLTTLELAGTKFGYDGLYQILDDCTLLEKLDLTSCRGVKVGDRRRFFETWNMHREGSV